MIRRPGADNSKEMVRAEGLQMARKAGGGMTGQSRRRGVFNIGSSGQDGVRMATGMPTGKRGRGRMAKRMRRKAKRQARRMQGFNRLNLQGGQGYNRMNGELPD